MVGSIWEMLQEVLSNENIHDLIMRNRRLTVSEITSVWDVSKSPLFNILMEDSKWCSSVCESGLGDVSR